MDRFCSEAMDVIEAFLMRTGDQKEIHNKNTHLRRFFDITGVMLFAIMLAIVMIRLSAWNTLISSLLSEIICLHV